MTYETFEIGEKVKVIGTQKPCGNSLRGMVGKVVAYNPDELGQWYGVEFEEPVPLGIDCNGAGRDKCCRWIDADLIMSMSSRRHRTTKAHRWTLSQAQKAYDSLVHIFNCKKATKSQLTVTIEEAIGYLGAALE